MSNFEDKIMGTSVPIGEELIKYGFKMSGDVFLYEKDIMDGQFHLCVKINGDGVLTELTDSEFKEPYVLYKMEESTGEFNGRVRTAVEDALQDIKQKCFDCSVFASDISKSAIKYVKQKYCDELEFLWEDLPDTAILRRKDTGKWYAVILKVNALKLGIDEEKLIELILMRGDPKDIDNKTVFIGWHMNKKSWISMILDSRSSEAELFKRIDESYGRAIK